MRTKCYNCLCRSCMRTCCDRKNCTGKKEACENYSGFRQLSFFDPPPRQTGTPRYPIEYYGLTDERVAELENLVRFGGKDIVPIASLAAYKTDKIIYGHILLSIQRKLSYEGLEKMWARGDIERMPYCRTDFYGIRRYFYSLFDKELRRIGK